VAASLQEGETELDPASADQFLDSLIAKKKQPARELSPDEADAFIEGIIPRKPATPGPIGSFLGSATEQTGTALRGVGAMGDYMAQMEPPSSYGGRGPLPGGMAPPVQTMPGSGLLEAAGGALEQAGQTIYPPESRGTGSFLGESLPAMAGGLAPGLAAGMVNPGLGAATFGAQFGAPAYFQTLKETGDTTKAVESYLGNAAIAQLNELGFGAPLKRILGKFGSEAGQKALSSATLLWDMAKGAGKGNLALAAQAGLSAKLDEVLTGQDRQVLKEMGASLTSPEGAAVGGFLGFLGSLQRPRAAKEAPEVKGEAKPVQTQPEKAPEATQPEAVTEAEKAQARKIIGRPEPVVAGAAPTMSESGAAREERRARAMKAVEQMGKAAGASEEEIASSHRLLKLVPDEMLDTEFAEQARKLRGGEPLPAIEEPPKAAPEELRAKADQEIGQPIPPEPAPVSEPKAALETTTKSEAKPGTKIIEMFAGLPPFRGKATEFSAEKTKAGLRKVGRKFVQNLLLSHGAKPKRAARLEELAKGELEVESSRATSASRAVDQAVKAHNKANPASPIELEHITEALKDQTGAKTAALPPGVREPTERMRAHMDKMSRIMIDEGMTNQTMTEVYKGRLGEYMRSTYKAHIDPKWADKIEPEVRNKLESLLVSWSQPPDQATIKSLEAAAKNKKLNGELRRQALFELKARKDLQGKTVEQVRAGMEAMLDDARLLAENPYAAMAKSNLKRKDLSVFKPRKGIPDEMKAFLGEEKNPLVAYTNTIIKQAAHIASHRKFVAMRAEGLGKWLFEEPTTKGGTNYTTRVSAGDNPRLAPLVQGKDLYTTAEIKKALFDADTILNHPIMKWLTVLNSGLKGTKTIYDQPKGTLRQAWQQIAPLVRNGYAVHAFTNAKRIGQIMFGKSPEMVAEREKLIRLRVIDTSITAAEIKDIRDISAARQLNQPWKTIAKASEKAAALFSHPDNFTKIAGWEVEKKNLMEQGLSEAAAEEKAADRIRDLLPTYSRIAKGPDFWRRQPVFGTFMAFKAEQGRNTFSLLRLISEEVKDPNPVVRKQGLKRAAHALAGAAMYPLASKVFNMVNGVDQEQDDRNRKRASEFDEQRNLIWTPNDTYVDVSDLDDGSYLTDPIMRTVAGEDPEKVIKEMVRENFYPFGEPSLITKTFVHFWEARDEYGKPMDGKNGRQNKWQWLRDQILPFTLSKKIDFGRISGLGVRKLGHVRRGA